MRTFGEAEPFVRELAALSDKLQVVVHDVEAEPATAAKYGLDRASDAESPGSGAIRFLRLPVGYGFSPVETSGCRNRLTSSCVDSIRTSTCRSLSPRLDPTAAVRPGWPTRCLSPIRRLRRI